LALDTYPELFEVDAIQQLKNNFLNTTQPLDPSLWRIACFGIWCRVFNVKG